jgi:hypothetical protein
VFARLRRDLEYERVDPSEADRLGELFAGEGHTGYSVRRVLQRGTVVGAVVSVPISDAEETRVRRGVLDGLSSRPGTPRSTVREVGRLFATVHTFPPAGDGETEQSFALLRSGCCSYLVLGAGEDEAVDIAGAVLGTARTR